MKRPAFQFYPADWRNNAKLRRCSWAARGVWIEVMGLMHDSDEYGVLRWTLKEIANAVGASAREINELVAKGVLYGCASGDCEPMKYQPKHGRVLGDEVVLIPAQVGPIWYSPRMVRDEYVRTKRGANTRFGEDFDPSPKGGFGDGFGDAPKRAPSHRQGDGSTSSSSSSLTLGEVDERSDVATGPGEQARSVQIAVELRRLGMRDVTGTRPEVLELAAAGYSDQQLADAVLELTESKGAVPKVGYLAATLRGRALDAKRPAAASAQRRPSVTDSFAGRKYDQTPDSSLPQEFRDAVAHLA